MEMKNFSIKMLHVYVLYISIFLMITAIQPIETVSLQSCHSNQKLRGTICCNTVKCSPGQEFKICTEDQGHDTCQNCPQGLTHFDELDSKDWDYQLKPCIEKDGCSESDLAIIDGVCSCNRNEGYYGRDRNKCAVDDGTCKKAGYQLTIDGDCVMCDEDHFKAEKETYGLCTPKTRCGNDQEIHQRGSSQKDRTCRAKYTTVKNVQTLPPTTSVSTNSNGYDTSNHTEKGNITRNEVHPTTTVAETPENNKSNNNEWIIPLVSVLSVGFIILIIFIYMKMRTNGTDKQSTGTYSLFSCCQNVTNTNIDTDLAICGNNNKTIFTPSSSRRDDNDCEKEQFIQQNREEV